MHEARALASTGSQIGPQNSRIGFERAPYARILRCPAERDSASILLYYGASQAIENTHGPLQKTEDR